MSVEIDVEQMAKQIWPKRKRRYYLGVSMG